jgi:argininosuccinate lyase
LYRSRPEADLGKEVLSFLSSIEEDRKIQFYDIIGTQSHVIMLYEQEYLNSKEVKVILKALEEAKRSLDIVPTDGFEDIHEAVEAFVIAHAGMDAGGKIHTARSRNDQISLDLRLKARDDINLICKAGLDFALSLHRKAQENQDTIMPLYTHMQQAQLGTFSHFLISYEYALTRDIERLIQLYERINRSPLGACAIAGTSINIDRTYTARILGFAGLVVNSIDATSSRDVFVEFISALALLMTSVSRLAEDLIIWSTSEFGFVELDDAYSSTSSAMPQKKNPDPLEIARGKAGSVIGDLVSMFSILKSLPSGYDRDLQEMKPPLFRAASSTLATLKVMKGVIDSIKINKEKMAASSAESYATAIDIAELLVENYKVPFRVAHKLVGMTVNRAVSKGNVPLRDLSVNDLENVILSSGIQGSLQLSGKKMHGLIRKVSTHAIIQNRKSSGSTQLKEQQSMFKELSESIDKYSSLVNSRSSEVDSCFKMLEKQVKQLTGASR